MNVLRRRYISLGLLLGLMILSLSIVTPVYSQEESELAWERKFLTFAAQSVMGKRVMGKVLSV